MVADLSWIAVSAESRLCVHRPRVTLILLLASSFLLVRACWGTGLRVAAVRGGLQS